MNIKEIKLQIIERVMPPHPEKNILFGSFTYGNPATESDRSCDRKMYDNYDMAAW